SRLSLFGAQPSPFMPLPRHARRSIVKWTHLVVLGIASGAACSAPVDGVDSRTGVSAEALTVSECQGQLDDCYAENPFFGLFTCPGQYTQCLVTASNGIPAQVQSAVSDARMCREQAVDCRKGIENPEDAIECTQKEAECVADIVGARLPPIVTGSAECVED